MGDIAAGVGAEKDQPARMCAPKAVQLRLDVLGSHRATRAQTTFCLFSRRTPEWRKSTHSGHDGGECVEVSVLERDDQRSA
jgi:hypothetical protein